MFQRPEEKFIAILFLLTLNGTAAAAEKDSVGDYSLGDEVPLHNEDLRQIHEQVLAQNPLLSSSPGIKAAFAQRSVRSTDIADVVFYPHTESAGIKSAFQVGCSRRVPAGTWSCNDAEIRRYIALDSQDFEVRVVGSINSTAAIALIHSARQVLRSGTKTRSTVPDTVVLIRATTDGYFLSFRPSEGNEGAAMRARLRTGGDPGNPADWMVTRSEQRHVVGNGEN